jgi:hypothetical protein
MSSLKEVSARHYRRWISLHLNSNQKMRRKWSHLPSAKTRMKTPPLRMNLTACPSIPNYTRIIACLSSELSSATNRNHPTEVAIPSFPTRLRLFPSPFRRASPWIIPNAHWTSIFINNHQRSRGRVNDSSAGKQQPKSHNFSPNNI